MRPQRAVVLTPAADLLVVPPNRHGGCPRARARRAPRPRGGGWPRRADDVVQRLRAGRRAAPRGCARAAAAARRDRVDLPGELVEQRRARARTAATQASQSQAVSSSPAREQLHPGLVGVLDQVGGQVAGLERRGVAALARGLAGERSSSASRVEPVHLHLAISGPRLPGSTTAEPSPPARRSRRCRPDRPASARPRPGRLRRRPAPRRSAPGPGPTRSRSARSPRGSRASAGQHDRVRHRLRPRLAAQAHQVAQLLVAQLGERRLAASRAPARPARACA